MTSILAQVRAADKHYYQYHHTPISPLLQHEAFFLSPSPLFSSPHILAPQEEGTPAMPTDDPTHRTTRLRPFHRPGESNQDRADGVQMAPPSAWPSQEAYEKALRSYDRAQAFLATQGGVDPAIAAAQEHQFHTGMASGTLSAYKSAKIAQLAEEARMRPSDSSQLRRQATLLISGGQTPQTWNAVPTIAGMQTRAQHLAGEEQAKPEVEAFYEKMAQAASRKAGRAVSVEEIRSFVPSLSGQQLSYVTSNAPVDVALAGPGSGKSTATRAKVLYDILVNGTDPKEYVFTSKTHSANRNFVEGFSSDASQGRRDVSEIVPGWTRDVREKQTKTLDYLTRKQLHAPLITRENGEQLAPIQVLQMAAQTEKGRHLLAAEGLSDFSAGAQPLYQKPVGRQSFIDDDVEQAQKSLSSFIAKAMKQQGIEQKSYDLAETTHYVIDSKQKRMSGSFQDRMARGRTLFEAFEQSGRQVPPMGQVDPDLALYVTQQAMSARPGFTVPKQESAHYDLSDEGHMLSAALRIARKIPSMQVQSPIRRLVSDEFQDADPNHVATLKELAGTSGGVRMAFSGDMGQMAVRRNYPIDQQVMEAFGSVGVQKHVFTGNYRAGAYGVSLTNAINTLSVMQGQPQSPMQVSMRPMGQTDLPPKMYLGTTYGNIHRKMVKDWLKNTGVSLGDIGQAMEEGRHPFAGLEGTQNAPGRNPFVFQTENVQKSFLGTLKQMLSREMGQTLTEQFMTKYVSTAVPAPEHAMKMAALKINAIRGRDAERAYLDVGQAGMWDVAGYADNLRVMTSRAKQQNRLYASMETLPGTTPHDMTPSQFQGEAVAPGFDVLLQVMSELTHHQQSVPLQQMPGWMARSAVSPTQMTYAREGGAGPVQDSALMEQYASEVFALNRHYQPEVGAGSGVMSLDEVGREAVYGTAGGEGDDATAMDQMNTFGSLNNMLGRNKNGVDRTQLDLVHSFMRQSLIGGPSSHDFGELPEDTSSLISFFQQQFGRVNTPHADELMGGPLPRLEEFFGKTEGLGQGTLKVLSGDPHAMVRADDLASVMAARYGEYAPLARPEDDPDRAGRASTGEDGGQLVYADEVRTRGGLADLLKYTQHDPMVVDQMQQTLHRMGKQYMGPLAEDEIGKFAFKMPLSPSFVQTVTNAGDVYADNPSHHEGFRNYLRRTSSRVREQYGTHEDLFAPIKLSQEHLDRIGRVDPFHAAVTRALLQDGSLFLPKHEYSRLPKDDQGFLKGMLDRGDMQYNRKKGQLEMSAQKYGARLAEGGLGSDVRKRVYQLMRSNLYDVGAANAYGETVMHPEVRKRLNQFEYLPGAVMRTLSPQEGARMRIPVHQMRNAPAITRLTSYLSLMSKGMGTNETGGIIDPQAVIAHPQGGFQSLGAGMSLPQYEARLRDQMKRMGPQFLKTKWGTHLFKQYDQVRSMRQSFSSPQNLNRYAHALRVVLRATTGEDVQGDYKNRESLDPIRRFFAPAVGHARSVGQVMNVHQSLERAASHLEEHGSLRRSHVDDILTAFGHDPQNKQFTALRHLERNLLFKPTKQNANPSLSLEALIESFSPEGRDRNDLVAQMTRTPLLPGRSYQFMGGEEGFGGLADAQLRHGGVQAGMVGHLESFDEKTPFGMSKFLGAMFGSRMLTQDEVEYYNQFYDRATKTNKLAQMHMQPLLQFVSQGDEGKEAVRFPVRADQLRLAPHDLITSALHSHQHQGVVSPSSSQEQGEGGIAPSFAGSPTAAIQQQEMVQHQDILAALHHSGPLPRSISGPLARLVDAGPGSGARQMARLIEAPHQVLSGRGGGSGGLPEGGPHTWRDRVDDIVGGSGTGGMGGRSGGGGNLPPAPPISPPPPPPPPPSSGGPSFSNAAPLSDLASLGTLLRTQHEMQVGGVTVYPPTQEQRHILDTQAQHMLIEGGPGAGKTLTVGTKIADMIARGEILPEEIAAMSATRSGAQELTKRFGWIGSLLHQIPGLARDSRYKMPHASTFHGMAYRTLFGNQFPTDPSQNAPQFSPLLQAMGLGHFTKDKGVLTNVPAEDISWMTPNELKMMGTLHSQGDFFTKAVEPYLAARKGQVGGSQAKLLNAVLRGDRGRDKALESIGVIKRGTIESYQAAQARGAQHVSQGVVSHEALLHLYEQRQHQQGMPDFDDIMNFAGVAIQGANAGHLSKDLLPDFLSQQRLFTVDEGQDLFHNQARLLKGMMEHSRGQGGDPRLLVGFDRGQALFPGLGGLENPVGVYSNVVGAGVPLAPLTLRGNMRSDRAAVALNNAILSMPQMQSEPGKSPMQFPFSQDRGSNPSFLMRHSQGSLYQTAFRSMLAHSGVSPDEMGANIAAGKHPFEGIDFSEPGRTLPSQIPMIFSMRQQQNAFDKQAQAVLAQHLGLSDTKAHDVLHQIYRRGAPSDRMSGSEVEAAQRQFWGMRVAGARSRQFSYPHMDVTRVGQWLDDKNVVSYLKNMFTGLSRVSRGGQNVVLATDRPYQHMSAEQAEKNAFETYGGKQVPAMFGQIMGLASEQLASFGPPSASPSLSAAAAPPPPGNAPSFVSPLSTPSSQQGGPLPLSGKELDYAKQQAGPMLMEWINKMGSVRKRQGGDGWASPIAKELQEQADASYRAFQIKPQGRAAYDAVRDWTALRDYHKQAPGASLGLGLTPPQWPTGGKHDLLPFLHAYRDHMPGGESNDIIGDLPPLGGARPSSRVPSGPLPGQLPQSGRSASGMTPPPPVQITAGQVSVSGSNPVVTITSTSSPSLGGGGATPSPATPSGVSSPPIPSSGAGGGGGGGPLPSRWKYSPWNVGGGGGGATPPPPTPSMPIVGTGGGGGSGDEENAASDGPARSGGRSSSGGGGGSGSSFNNVASNFGRTLARIGYEMQFVGKLFNQITQQAVDQGSSYRRATLGLSGSGQDGTSGFFSFENGGPIDTFQQQNLPMYSKVQLAQQMKSIAAASGTQQGLMGTTQDVLSLAAISGIDPSQLIGQTTSISGTLGAAGQTSQISQQLMGGLTSMYGSTLGPENVTPTLEAVSQVLPTLSGLSAPSDVNSQLSPTLALFQSALAGGMAPSNFGEVSSAIGGLAQMGSTPDLQQQYVLSQLFGEQHLTANPQLQEYQRQQLSEQQNLAEVSLQQNINGQGLSLPRLQMQIGQADISMEKANLDMSALQYSHDVASFQFQQQQQTAEYGPIGADVSRNSYFDFMRNQMQAGYNPLSAETGTTFKSNPTFGLQNAEFYAGVEHQRTMLTLGRSPLLNDAAYQEQMKYLNEQEAFYHEQLQLQNAQRQFEKDWTQKLLDQQGVLLDLQKKRYGLDVVMNAYQQKMLGIQDKYLPLMAANLSALIAAQNQFLRGQGPVNGQNVTPGEILTRLSGLPDAQMKSLVSASRLPLDQQNALEKMIEGINRSGGLAKLEASQNPNDKKLLAQAQSMIKQGAFADQTSQASVADAFLNFAGKGGTWQNFVTAFAQANQHWRDIGQGLSSLNSTMKDIGTSLTILGPLAVAIGTIANGLGFAQSLPGLASALGKGKLPSLPGTGGEPSPDYTDPARYAPPVEETPVRAPGVGFMGAGMYPDAPKVQTTFRTVKGVKQYSMDGGKTWQNANDNYFSQMGGAIGNFFTKTIPGVLNPLLLAHPSSSSSSVPQAAGSGTMSGIGTFFSKTLPQWFSDHIGGPFNTFIGTTLPKWFSDHIGGPFNTFVFTTLPKWFTDHIGGPFMTWIVGVPKWMNDHIGAPFLSWVGTLPKFFMDHIGTPFMGFVTGLPKWFMDHIGTPFMTGVITPLTNLVTKTIPDGFTTLFTKTIPDLFTKTIPTAFTDTLKNVFGLGAGGNGSSSSSSQNGSNNFLSTLFTSIFGGAPKGGGGSSVASFASTSHPGFDTPRITTEFGQNTGHGPHQGVDFAVPQGTPTKEFIGGRVAYAGWQPWGGEVDVQIPGGMLERYLHLSALGVTKGQLVPRNGFLGLSGGGTPQSGLGTWSSGPHSHVQIDHGNMLAASNPWPIWAAFGATDISAFYGGSVAMMKQSQTSEVSHGGGGGGGGGGGTPLHHLSTGGITLSHIRTSLGESGPEAVIPLSRIGSVLRSVQQQQAGGTADTATSSARAVTIGHLIGTLNLTVGSGSGGSGGSAMSESEKDELLSDLLDILSTAAKRFVDQVH